jgi:hypothetical protein
MTKDLAVCIHGNNPPAGSYMTTDDFLTKLADNLKKKMM